MQQPTSHASGRRPATTRPPHHDHASGNDHRRHTKPWTANQNAPGGRQPRPPIGNRQNSEAHRQAANGNVLHADGEVQIAVTRSRRPNGPGLSGTPYGWRRN
ncbi:MAG: hypothetical protein OXG35_01080 [Acidobacteria bacterium]|nr:hypothetical protein [Acidobacteriota bacterium]